MRQMTLTQSRAPGHVIGWINFKSALNTWISSKFSALYWICLLFIFLILVGSSIYRTRSVIILGRQLGRSFRRSLGSYSITLTQQKLLKLIVL